MREANTERTRSRIQVLEQSETYTTLDPSGLRHRLRDLPGQCQEAWASSTALDLAQHRGPFTKVVIGGMGGSAIAGDLVADLAARQPSVPILLVRDFALPWALDDSSLFIGCSFSGATEETLSLFRQALRQGAQTLVITGGGVLAKESRAAGTPVLEIKASGEPRSAVGYNLMLLLGALSHLGIVKTGESEVQAAVAAAQEQIDRCREEIPASENPAKQLADELVDKLVVVYGGGLFSATARRWKTQLNENSKAWAFFETLPELLHNSVEAFARQAGNGPEKIVLVLQPSQGGPDLERRYRALSGLLKEGNIPHRVVPGAGGPPLAELLSMLVLGDYVSYYLALLQGLDPSPTPFLDRGKELLQGS